MIKYNYLTYFLSLVLFPISSLAFENYTSNECIKSQKTHIGLFLYECNIVDSVFIEKYHNEPSQSIYATEFDQRTVVIARGEEISTLKKIAGIDDNKIHNLQQRHLLLPPFPYQISKIEIEKNTKYKEWEIIIKNITYNNQGNKPGFLIKCATAIRIQKEDNVILAECFPFEEKIRFIKTLDLIQ